MHDTRSWRNFPLAPSEGVGERGHISPSPIHKGRGPGRGVTLLPRLE